jgi:hypothetical protein
VLACRLPVGEEVSPALSMDQVGSILSSDWFYVI